ncbi:unnamed protein product [Heterobilharzia americana]|nr:unnamed protein product [Heterobilharzia americana]
MIRTMEDDILEFHQSIETKEDMAQTTLHINIVETIQVITVQIPIKENTTEIGTRGNSPQLPNTVRYSEHI